MRSSTFLVTLFVLGCFSASALAARESPFDFEILEVFKEKERAPRTFQGDVGERLYLTPYLEADDIETARTLAEVTLPLDGLQPGEQPVSYSGYITVKPETNSHIFFWFFPATEVADPTTAPVSLWLQGGPGSSSMLGLFEINGPYMCLDDGAGGTQLDLNPYTWSREVNMIYIDQPTGTGFSHTDSAGLVVDQDQVATDLYEMLTQWFKMFPEYDGNPFFVFGESYGGKYVPSISRRIHDENESPSSSSSISINFQGLGIGNGAMDPYNSHIYGEFLYQDSLLDEIGLADCLTFEQQMKTAITNENWFGAWLEWSLEVSYFLSAMGCNYYLDFRQCTEDPEEANYNDFVDKDSTRLAIHVGDVPFGGQSGDVYNALTEDIMKSQRYNVEFLLDRYPVLIYNGNMDIVCHHTGTLEMFNAMTDWSAIDEFHNTESTVYSVAGETAGYLTSVQNLRLLVLRNAGHMVPRSVPEVADDFFNKFIQGNL